MKSISKPLFFAAGVLVLLALFSCSVSSTSRRKKAATNTTTPGEQQSGWISLFDGRTTDGWRPFRNKAVNSWAVEEGVLHCKAVKGTAGETRGDLITVDQFENFELTVDWKIAPKGNSGIIYMVSEKTDVPHLSGPEYQLIDDEGYPQKLEDWQKTGANYAMNPPTKLVARPVGEWNNTRIVVNNGHVEHWLNGVKVVDYDLWTEKWKADKVAGKWKDAPDYAASKQGHIALQDHGTEAWFKNIKIRKLP